MEVPEDFVETNIDYKHSDLYNFSCYFGIELLQYMQRTKSLKLLTEASLVTLTLSLFRKFRSTL